MKIRSILTAAVVCGMLSGCAANDMKFSAQGKEFHNIDCATKLIEMCNSKAAEVCPNGYEIVSNDPGSFWTLNALVITTKMTIMCKKGKYGTKP